MSNPEARQINFEQAGHERPFEWMPENGFLDENRDNLQELFTALGREDEWQLDADGNPTQETLDYMWVRWMGETHGYTGDARDMSKEKFTAEDKARVWPIVSRLHYGPYSLTEAINPPADTPIDQMWVVGGTDKANWRRMLKGYEAEENGSPIREVIFWGGQRPRMNTEGSMADIALATLLDPRPYDSQIVGSLSSKWAKRQLELSDNGEWDRPFATEDDLGRLSMSRLFPGIEKNYRRARIDMQPQPEPGMPPRFIATREFQNGDQKFVLLNGKGVPRPHGDPRHTTESCTLESLQFEPPTDENGNIKEDATILIATGNPHLRTAMQAILTARQNGWDKLNFHIACSSMAPSIPLITLLGEIPATMKYDMLLRQKIN
jgi:hypothetical protein